MNNITHSIASTKMKTTQHVQDRAMIKSTIKRKQALIAT